MIKTIIFDLFRFSVQMVTNEMKYNMNICSNVDSKNDINISNAYVNVKKTSNDNNNNEPSITSLLELNMKIQQELQNHRKKIEILLNNAKFDSEKKILPPAENRQIIPGHSSIAIFTKMNKYKSRKKLK